MAEELKSKNDPNRKLAQRIVSDILDPNDKAEINPDEIPKSNGGVINKSNKKGLYRLKEFLKNRKNAKKS
jgi:hypothetical protein